MIYKNKEKKNAIAISLILRYIPQHFRLAPQDCRGKCVDVDSMPGEEVHKIEVWSERSGNRALLEKLAMFE